MFAVVYDVGETGPDLQRSKDPSDGFGYMPDIWDDYCGSRCHWTRCRDVHQQGLPFGNFVTIDICPSIYLASEVLNSQSVSFHFNCFGFLPVHQVLFGPLQHLAATFLYPQILKGRSN